MQKWGIWDIWHNQVSNVNASPRRDSLFLCMKYYTLPWVCGEGHRGFPWQQFLSNVAEIKISNVGKLMKLESQRCELRPMTFLATDEVQHKLSFCRRWPGTGGRWGIVDKFTLLHKIYPDAACIWFVAVFTTMLNFSKSLLNLKQNEICFRQILVGIRCRCHVSLVSLFHFLEDQVSAANERRVLCQADQSEARGWSLMTPLLTRTTQGDSSEVIFPPI